MKCNNCGLPLSPERRYTNCPRCGAATSSVPGAQTVGSQQSWGQSNEFQQGGNMPLPPNNNAWGVSPSPYTPPAQSGWNQPYPGNQPMNQPQFDSGWQQQPFGTQPSQPQGQWGQQAPYTPPLQNAANRTNKGFMKAAILIIVGAIILLAVFIGILTTKNHQASTANQTSPSNNTNTNQTAVDKKTPTASPATATPGAKPTATPTPAGNFPGKAFIDQPQTATKVDQTTGLVVTPSKTFTIKQNIYIDFQIHAQGKDGAVCLVWYLNKQPVSNYSFDVKAKGTTQVAYAYSVYNLPGSAYVEMYWASNTTCADKQLAQHSDFTVTP